MVKQLLSCFGFVLVLIGVAAVNTLTAQPQGDGTELVEVYSKMQVDEKIAKITGDNTFMAKKILELETRLEAVEKE